MNSEGFSWNVPLHPLAGSMAVSCVVSEACFFASVSFSVLVSDDLKDARTQCDTSDSSTAREH